MSLRDLAGHTVWAAVGTSCYALGQWLCMLLVARLLGAAEVGKFALILAVTAPVFGFLSMDLRAVVATGRSQNTEMAAMYSLRGITSSIGVILLLAYFMYGATYDELALSLVLGIVFAKAFESLSDIRLGVFQRHARFSFLAISQAVRGIVGTILFAVGLLITEDLGVATLCWAAGFLIGYLSWDLPRSRMFSVQEPSSGEQSGIAAVLRATWPLGIVLGFNLLQGSIPRYQIASIVGSRELGLFAAVFYFGALAALPVNALGAALMSKFASLRDSDRSALRRLTRVACVGVMGYGLFLAGASILVGDMVVEFAYGEEFAGLGSLLAWVFVACAFMYSTVPTGIALTATGMFEHQAVTSIVVAATMLAAGLILIPNFGLIGGAIALLVGYLVKLGVQLFKLASL